MTIREHDRDALCPCLVEVRRDSTPRSWLRCGCAPRVDRESRYKAKAFIDTAIYRGGDLVNGWIMAGIVAMKVPLGEVALVGLVVACVWALLGWRVGRTHDEHLAAAGTVAAPEFLGS